MAKNKGQPLDDNSLEAFLMSQNEKQMKQRLTDLETTKKSLENQKDIIKNIKAVYTPVSKTQTLLVDFNKNQVNANRSLQSSIDKNTELLKQNVSNTKALYSFLEKAFDPSKKQQPTQAKNAKEKKPNDNFDNKARHEQSILGTEDTVTPVLKSIKGDTEKIVKLLEAQAKVSNEKVKPDSGSWFDKLPPSPKFLPWLLPLIAAAAAVKHPEVGNGVKAGLGVATAGARVLAPLAEAAKAGASTASGMSKVAAAAASARAAANATTFRTAMTGPAPMGAMGKLGVGLGAGATAGRLMDGDTTGATFQGISTLLPLLLSKTKYGKLAGLASAGIDVGLLGRDYIKYQDKKEEAELRGETIKSPLQNFKDDVSKVGAFFGIGDGPDSDPVVQNTAETNKILEEIRDNKSLANPGINANSMVAPAMMAGATALMLRGGMGARLGQGVASTGIGQRIMGGVAGAGATARSTAGALGNTAMSGLKAGAVGAGKMAGKLIPGVGLVMGAYGAYDKIKQGDLTGAAIEGASGIASLIPGIGTAVAIGLQGISATRDVIKATNAETASSIKATSGEVNKALVSSTNDNNNMLKDSNASLSASILANSELTNKNISETSKNANNSLTQSASTLTTTTNNLASSLTSASTSLLGMIAKFSVPGLMVQGAQAVNKWINGSAPEANAHAPTGPQHESRKTNMMGVYSAFLKAGMSEAQAKAMTAEIGRENEYGNDLWKTHKDHKNGKMNVGMMSWQNGRDEKLMEYLRKKGVVNKDGTIQRSQAALDAQAEFAVHELRTSHKSVGDKFLSNKNISYQDASKMLGREFFKWRYDDENYANGHKRRDTNYANLNSEIYKRGFKSPEKKINYVSQKHFDKISKAEARPLMMESQKKHDAWKKREDARIKELSAVQKGILDGTTVIGNAPKEEKKSNISVPYANQAVDEGASKSSNNISNKEYYNLGLKSVVVAKGVDMGGLTSACREAFYTMIGELFSTKNPKNKAVVTSAFRSPQKQQALWQEALKKYGSEEKARKWVAPPGRSKHEKGLALDVDYKGGATVKLLESSGLLKKYNFTRPLSNEPWHIEFGSGSVGATASALGSAISSTIDEPDFKNLAEVGDAAVAFAAQGLSTMLSGGAMDSIREFIKGGKVDAPRDSNPVPKAFGKFTQDESDPTRTMPKDSGNGDFWENLDQQLGNGTLQRQERNQAEYDKVKKAWEGKQGIFRQIGGKYGWLSEMFSGLFGEDNLLSNVFGVLTGSQDVAGLPKLFDKAIIGKNTKLDQMGAIGGGFGGGLAENNKDAYPLIADHSSSESGLSTIGMSPEEMGAVGGGFGGGINQSKTETQVTKSEMPIAWQDDPILNQDISKLSPEDQKQLQYARDMRDLNIEATKALEKSRGENSTGEIKKATEEGETYNHFDGSKTVYNPDGSYVYTRADGRISYINADGTVAKIEKGEPPVSVPNVTDGGISYSSSDVAIGMSPEEMGAFGGGFGGAIRYDDTINRYEDQEFEKAKYNQEKMEEQRRKIEVSIPQPTQTPTAQAPGGGKSSRTGLTGGTTFTRNPDSIIQQVAIAMMRSSL